MLLWEIAGLVVIAIAEWLLLSRLPDRLDRYTARHMGKGVPQLGRYVFSGLGIAVGLISVAATLWLPFPAVYGPFALLLYPLWERTQKRNLTPLMAPIQYGLKNGRSYLYLLSGLATVIGILKLATPTPSRQLQPLIFSIPTITPPDSTVSAALLGLLGVLLGYVIKSVTETNRSKRETAIRADERAEAKRIRGEDQVIADQRRTSDLDAAARTREEEYQRSEAARHSLQGEGEARALLSLLAELKVYFAQEIQSSHGAYSYNPDLSRRIAYQLLLVPAPDLRDYISIGMTVINETWVLEETEGVPGSAQAAQRSTLDDMMKAVGSYIVGENDWDRDAIEVLRKIKAEDIDIAYQDYFAERD